MLRSWSDFTLLLMAALSIAALWVWLIEVMR